MKYYIILFGTLLFLGLFGCTPFTEQKITHPEDYSRFLNYDKKTNKNLSHIDEGLIFWEAKIKDQPNSHLYLLKKSDLLAKRFRISGNVEDLLVSDSLLNIANKITKGKYANIYHRMSTNAITKHQFRKARQFLQEASKLGENKQTTLLMTFDVDMETGYQQYGDDHLSRIGNKNSFDYLFRYAQYMDHTGKLDSAIYFMEKAMDRVKNEKNVSLQCWALTNLGDMYGHNNQVSEAYQCYLNTLNLDPYYAYALKGIAKIAYAHDLDIDASNEIIDFLHSQYNWPDLYLLQAEMAEYSGNLVQRDQLIEEFLTITNQSKYMGLYTRHQIIIASEISKDFDLATSLAWQEVNERPSARSFDLLAWTYFLNNDWAKAGEIWEEEVIGLTEEPDVMMRVGTYYHAIGEYKNAKKYLKLAKESSFELGPVCMRKINVLLKN